MSKAWSLPTGCQFRREGIFFWASCFMNFKRDGWWIQGVLFIFEKNWFLDWTNLNTFKQTIIIKSQNVFESDKCFHFRVDFYFSSKILQLFKNVQYPQSTELLFGCADSKRISITVSLISGLYNKRSYKWNEFWENFTEK